MNDICSQNPVVLHACAIIALFRVPNDTGFFNLASFRVIWLKRLKSAGNDLP